MTEEIKWRWYELKRLYRLWVNPEPSVREFARVVGVYWLWRHGIQREFRIYPWSNRREWYAPDWTAPHLYKAIEVDGLPHWNAAGKTRDVIRDQRLSERGWVIRRVDARDLTNHPKAVRRSVRQFFKG